MANRPVVAAGVHELLDLVDVRNRIRHHGPHPPSQAIVSAGAELRLVNGVTLSGKFDGELAQRSSTYAGTGTVRFTW